MLVQLSELLVIVLKSCQGLWKREIQFDGSQKCFVGTCEDLLRKRVMFGLVLSCPLEPLKF